MEVKLSNEETALLKKVFSSLLIRARTGELGIMHAGRFVSIHGQQRFIMKKEERELLDRVSKKLGLNQISTFDG